MPRKGKGQKVSVAKGQTYGKRAAQERAQEAVPMHRDAPPRPRVVPGQMGGLTRPTERPGEPMTSGAGVGPGPGPEVLSRPGPSGPEPLSAQLAAYLPILEIRAAQPDASANFRMFVRRVRALAAKSPGVV